MLETGVEQEMLAEGIEKGLQPNLIEILDSK